MQHDCRLLRCLPLGCRQERQERQITNRQVSLIKHGDDDHFVLNVHAFHNAGLLRQVLPRSLSAPIRLYDNSQAQHYELAAHLRESQTVKRANTNAKRAATRATNKAKKLATEAQRASGMTRVANPIIGQNPQDTEDGAGGADWGSDGEGSSEGEHDEGNER